MRLNARGSNGVAAAFLGPSRSRTPRLRQDVGINAPNAAQWPRGPLCRRTGPEVPSRTVGNASPAILTGIPAFDLCWSSIAIQLDAMTARARRQSDALARHHARRACSVEDISIERKRGMGCRRFRLDRPRGYMTLRLRAGGRVMLHGRRVENIAVKRINGGLGLLLGLSLNRRSKRGKGKA